MLQSHCKPALCNTAITADVLWLSDSSPDSSRGGRWTLGNRNKTVGTPIVPKTRTRPAESCRLRRSNPLPLHQDRPGRKCRGAAAVVLAEHDCKRLAMQLAREEVGHARRRLEPGRPCLRRADVFVYGGDNRAQRAAIATLCWRAKRELPSSREEATSKRESSVY